MMINYGLHTTKGITKDKQVIESYISFTNPLHVKKAHFRASHDLS